MIQAGRRNFLLTLGLLGVPPVRAQQPARVPIIGLLWNDSVKPSPFVATLVGALNEQGLVAGRDFRIDDRIGLEGYGSMAEGGAALARERVDLIVTYGRTATLAAAKATNVIPIVAIMGSDPVEVGLADSLAHPGRNVTGVVSLSSELVGKRVELLKELVPGLSKVAILIAGGAAGVAEAERSADAAARTLGLQPQVIALRALEDLDGAIAGVAKARIKGLYVGGSSMLAANANSIVSAISRHRIPRSTRRNATSRPGGSPYIAQTPASPLRGSRFTSIAF
jgi:putative ABC transport system substrate-binding protein